MDSVNEKFTQLKSKLITYDIDDTTFRILCYLISYSKEDVCYPSEYKIAEDLKKSRNTVHKCLLTLETNEIIRIEKRLIGEGKKTSNKYIINKDFIVPKQEKKIKLIDYDWLGEENE